MDLQHTELATAQCGTLRFKLLKVAAQIHISGRQVVIAFSSCWPAQSLFTRLSRFQQATGTLQQLPLPGVNDRWMQLALAG